MRNLLAYALGAFAMVPLFFIAVPAMILWPTHMGRTAIPVWYSRAWARFCFLLAGFRLEVRNPERLQQKPAVFLFNHVNMLDFFTCAAVVPRHTLVWGKRELLKVPFVGWVWFVSTHPLIDRKRRDRWQGQMDEVARRVGSGDYCTIIAPEGTRRRDAVLGPFKKGPFHLAIASGAPIVPLVLRHAEDRLTRRGLVPGPVVIDVLEPIPVQGWSVDTIDEHVEAVRQVYLRALAEG